MPEAVLKKGWARVAFGDVVKLSRERSNNPEAEGYDRFVGLEHLDPEDIKIRRWGDIANGTTFTNVFRPGQVLFGKRRAYQRKVAVADFSGVCSGDIYVLEAKDAFLLPELLPFICQTDGFFDHAVGTSAGSLSPRTNWDSLASYEFALPPMAEQRRAYYLAAAASSVIDHLSGSILCSENLLASIRASQFDPARHNPVELSSLCSEDEGIQIGPFGTQLHQSDYQPDGVPVVMPINIVDDTIKIDGIARVSEQKARSLAVHRIQKGDILLPRRGDLDRRAYVDESAAGWLCGTGSIRVRIRSTVSSRAVFHALASPHSVRWLNANAVGTTMPNLNTKIVGNVPIALPPQHLIETIINALQGLSAALVALRGRRTAAHRVRQHILSAALGTT